MANRITSFVEGEFYHIYNRGNSKQKIFLDDYDRDRFMKLLYLCNSETGIDFREDIVRKNIDAWDFDRGKQIVSIGAWVFMPNHFHLYITPRKQGFRKLKNDKINEVTYFMHKLLTSYSKYFNTKYKRTGALFESKFKSVYIENDNQAKYLFSYIHLNPVKLVDSNWKEKGIKDQKKTNKFLENYKWSSYLDYKDTLRPENKILNLKEFPEYFQDINDFDFEIEEWLTLKNNLE